MLGTGREAGRGQGTRAVGAGAGGRRSAGVSDLRQGHGTGHPVPPSSPGERRTNIELPLQRGLSKDAASTSFDLFRQSFSKIPRGLNTSAFAHQEKYRGHFFFCLVTCRFPPTPREAGSQDWQRPS